MSSGNPWQGPPELYAGSSNSDRALRIRRPGRVVRGDVTSGLSVCVLNLDKPELIGPLLRTLIEAEAILARRGMGFEVIVGDTGSADPAVWEVYRNAPTCVRVISGLAFHFSRSNNDCLEHARYDHLLLLNNDVVLDSPHPLIAMLDEFANHPATGAAGLVLDYPDGTVQHAGVDLLPTGPWRGFPYHAGAREPARHRPGTSYECIAATGACLMVRTELWNAVGGLDEDYARECQDIDLCFALRRLGYQVRTVDAGRVVHIENATRPVGEEDWADRRLFMRRWAAFVRASLLCAS